MTSLCLSKFASRILSKNPNILLHNYIQKISRSYSKNGSTAGKCVPKKHENKGHESTTPQKEQEEKTKEISRAREGSLATLIRKHTATHGPLRKRNCKFCNERYFGSSASSSGKDLSKNQNDERCPNQQTEPPSFSYGTQIKARKQQMMTTTSNIVTNAIRFLVSLIRDRLVFRRSKRDEIPHPQSEGDAPINNLKSPQVPKFFLAYYNARLVTIANLREQEYLQRKAAMKGSRCSIQRRHTDQHTTRTDTFRGMATSQYDGVGIGVEAFENENQPGMPSTAINAEVELPIAKEQEDCPAMEIQTCSTPVDDVSALTHLQPKEHSEKNDHKEVCGRPPVF